MKKIKKKPERVNHIPFLKCDCCQGSRPHLGVTRSVVATIDAIDREVVRPIFKTSDLLFQSVVVELAGIYNISYVQEVVVAEAAAIGIRSCLLR